MARKGTQLRRFTGTKRALRRIHFVLPCLRAFVPAIGDLRPIALLGCLLAIGCVDKRGPTSRPMTMQERQDQALRDPFGYDPKDVPTVTGGGIGSFDRQGFNRDVDHVLNP